MTSVERVFEYADLDSEPDNGGSKDLSDTWPEYGMITAEGASFSYHSSLPYVLTKLDFCIQPMEKVSFIKSKNFNNSVLLLQCYDVHRT